MYNQISKYFFYAVLILSAAACRNYQNANQKVDLKGITPPAIAKPVVELQYPAPVKIANQEKSSSQDTAGFYIKLEVDGKKFTDTSTVNGTIKEINNNKILITTQQGRQLYFSYKLPENERPLFLMNENVSIKQKEEVYDASLNKFLWLENKNGVIISSGHKIKNSPIEIAVDKNISLKQTVFDNSRPVSVSKYDSHFRAPVFLSLPGKRIQPIEANKELDFTVAQHKYKLRIFESSYIIPSKEYRSVSEGSGYLLRYMVFLSE